MRDWSALTTLEDDRRRDAVLDAATLQGETHMGTAIVKREDVPILVHEQDRAVAAVHDKPALGFQLFKTARVYEIRGRGIHGRLIREVSASAPFGKDLRFHPPS